MLKLIINKYKELKQYIKKWIYWGYKRATIYSLITKKDNHFDKILKAYWLGDNYIFLLENNKAIKGTILYNIFFNEKATGFFALVRGTIGLISFLKNNGLNITITWGNNTEYYDKRYGENVFEYFYMPVCEIDEKNVTGHVNISWNHLTTWSKVSGFNTSYNIGENEIIYLGSLYKKYFRLNNETEQYILSKINSLFTNKEQILGVHVRGTDYKIKHLNHPKFVPFIEYINIVKKLINERNYNKVFIATDDEDALMLFKNEFNDNLLYYPNSYRVTGTVGTHILGAENKRDNALDVLTDAYTLAHCNALVCGLSQVSFAARYIKYSLNKSFDIVHVMSDKIYN